MGFDRTPGLGLSGPSTIYANNMFRIYIRPNMYQIRHRSTDETRPEIRWYVVEESTRKILGRHRTLSKAVFQVRCSIPHK